MGNVSDPDKEDEIIPIRFRKDDRYSYIRRMDDSDENSVVKCGNIRKKSSEEEEIFLSPITPRFHSDIKFNFDTNIGKDLTDNPNYGKLPNRVFHEILLYLKPKDLVNAFCSCKLVYNVSSTNYFWRVYYQSYFKNIETRNSNEDVNWKKQFFKRFYFLTDCYYKKKFFKVKDTFDSKRYRKDLMFVGLGDDDDDIHDFFKSVVSEFYDESEIVVEGEFGWKICATGNHLQNEEFHISLYQPFTEDELPKRFDGVFLIFSVNERESFEKVKKIYETKLRNRKVKRARYTVYILCGTTSSSSEGSDNRREVQYDESVEYSKKNNFLGYIECKPKENHNCYLSFGILLEGVLRRYRIKEENVVVEMKLQLERNLGLLISNIKDENIVMK